MEITYLWFGTVTHSISLIITKRACTKGSGNKKNKKKNSHVNIAAWSVPNCTLMHVVMMCHNSSSISCAWSTNRPRTKVTLLYSHSAACWGRDLLARDQVFLIALPNRVIRCGDGLFYWSSRQAVKSWLFSKATVGFSQISSGPHRWDGPTTERSLQTTATLHNCLKSATARAYFFYWTLSISRILYILCSLFRTYRGLRGWMMVADGTQTRLIMRQWVMRPGNTFRWAAIK